MDARIVLCGVVIFAALELAGAQVECHSVETRKGRLILQLFSGAEPVTVHPGKVELLVEGQGMTRQVLGTELADLPYGEYSLQVRVGGFRTVRRSVAIARPETLERFELNVGWLGCPIEPPTLRGLVVGVKDGANVWVKAVALRGTHTLEVKALPSGEFFLVGLLHREYILVAYEGAKVLGTATWDSNRQQSEELFQIPAN